MEQLSKLDVLKNIIYSKKIGEILTRKEIRVAAGYPPTGKIDMTTYDSYRYYFCKAGYLVWIGSGKYEKVKNPNMSLTYNELLHESILR